MFFSVYTLGCKLNQLETEAITDAFSCEGFTLVPFDQGSQEHPDSLDAPKPDIIVINTCTVTSMAEQKARRIIRKQLRQYPGACLIVTGCYAQMERAALAALEDDAKNLSPNNDKPQRLFVVPGEKKDRILDLGRFLAGREAVPELLASWLGSLASVEPCSVEQGSADGAFRFRPENFASHSRAFLKIQDGCDRCCAYCRVSLARGKSRSLGAEEVLARLRALERRGFAEAVLTGVNISQYRDFGTALPGLAGLLSFLLEGTEAIRLRLSSIEPDELTQEFIRVVENPRIRPHFHLSLQSGSAEILAKMGRSYSPQDIEKAVKRLRSVRNDPFLACDIIAAFPGESAAEFDKTLALCGGIGFAWIHAFPFSPRPGTAANAFPGRVSEREAARRVELLTELGRKGRADYIRRWEGKEAEAIVESGKGEQEGFIPALTENYLKLRINCGEKPSPAPGSLIRCRILQAAKGRFDAIGAY